jgi:hypothetical protein
MVEDEVRQQRGLADPARAVEGEREHMLVRRLEQVLLEQLELTVTPDEVGAGNLAQWSQHVGEVEGIPDG